MVFVVKIYVFIYLKKRHTVVTTFLPQSNHGKCL